MDSYRKIERTFYVCPEVVYNSFPIIDEDEYNGMCSDFILHSSEICIYIYIRESFSYVPFVDIYIWSATNLGGFDRFIICDGFRLSEELETKFLEYVHNEDIYISDWLLHDANKKIIDAFPQWHYKDYRAKYLSIALQHLYFASHSSGPREILFKAEGVEYIAANLDKIHSYNLLGTTPSTIIEGIPLKLMRILNREAHFDLLCDQTSLGMCRDAYNAFNGYIGKDIPSVGQWNYILELYKNNGLFGGYPFKTEIYKKASYFVCSIEIEAYKRYFSIRRELNIPGKLTVPDNEEIWSTLGDLEELVWYKNGKTRMDRLITLRKTEESYRYEYANAIYEIVMPSRVFDMYWEALCQHNCLADYVSSHASGDTTILFLRKKGNSKEPFVTMEVENDEIVQVYGTCNKLPHKDVYEFIIEYAKEKVLSYDMRDLILKNLYKIDDNDRVNGNELVEFALYNQRSIKADPVNYIENVIKYHQIAMEECFPDIFEQEIF